MKKQITEISVQQTGKIFGLGCFLVASILIPIGIIQLIIGGKDRGIGILFIVMPLVYFPAGYLYGLLGAVIYSFIVKRFGGLEFTVKDIDTPK